jgi:REP element-mobilizing transposase RayT
MQFHPQRRPLRLKGYDSAEAGVYFVTVCTKNRDCLFGDVVDGVMQLSVYGEIVSECWKAIPEHFRQAQLDEFVIMPNHVHGILAIMEVGATHASPLRMPVSGTPRRPAGPKQRSLGAVIGSFKSVVSKRINEVRGSPGVSVWQRNYYEHIIRGDKELSRIREYVVNNPLQWEMDVENPATRSNTTRRGDACVAPTHGEYDRP